MAAPTFTQALEQAELLARQALPQLLHERISCAVALVKAGAVLETDTPHIWSVASASTPGKEYTVNGSCNCQDAQYRAPQGRCKHMLATMLARKTLKLMQGQDEHAQVEAPAPQERSAPANQHAISPQHHEAPASVNCHIMLEGRQVQLTLRDTDESRLLQRLAAVLKQYPMPAQPATQEKAQGWCKKHNVPMKLNNGKDGHSWWSHKTPEGWCKGK
jgi:hypothetical protein